MRTLKVIVSVLTFAGGILLFPETSHLPGQVSAATTAPVLVELFTSEGCSSCPPADALLQRLEQAQPVSGANVIALSEHVDYWNHDGWVDRFSSGEYTARQQMYVGRFHLPSGYTPQMVVDGVTELNGSDAAQAQRSIAEASKAEKLQVSISQLHSNDAEVSFHLAAEGTAGRSKPVDVIVALASASAETQVRAGENGGKTLHHVDVVRTMQRVGSLAAGAFANDLTIKLPPDIGSHYLVIAFVQEKGGGRVWGAASEKMAK